MTIKKIQRNKLRNKSAFICVYLRLIKSNEILGYNPKFSVLRPAVVSLNAKSVMNRKFISKRDTSRRNTDNTDWTDFHGYESVCIRVIREIRVLRHTAVSHSHQHAKFANILLPLFAFFANFAVSMHILFPKQDMNINPKLNHKI